MKSLKLSDRTRGLGLEGKLPELHRLIAEAELTFAMSDEAEKAGQMFLTALSQADDAAATLRRLLLVLGGTLPGAGEIPTGTPEPSASMPPKNEDKVTGAVTPGLVRTSYLPFETDLWSVYAFREPVREGWDVKRIFAITEPDNAQFLLVLDERPHALEDAPEDKTERQK